MRKIFRLVALFFCVAFSSTGFANQIEIWTSNTGQFISRLDSSGSLIGTIDIGITNSTSLEVVGNEVWSASAIDQHRITRIGFDGSVLGDFTITGNATHLLRSTLDSRHYVCASDVDVG